MAVEIIEAIRQAETQAAQAVQSAQEESNHILEKAKVDAASLKRDMTQQARDKAAQAMQEGEERCRQMLKEAEAQEAADGQALERIVEQRRGKAVEAVLSELL